MATLEGWDETWFDYAGTGRTVYRRGEGPGVVVMHEVPGIVPEVLRFATRVADAGFSVFLPNLFGEPGRAFSWGYALESVVSACVSREINVLARHQSSPITDWLRALARHAYAEIGGRGVGAIGMCITGNFALALAMDDVVMAPVLSQPSLPFSLIPGAKSELHLSPEELANLKRRAKGGLQVLGLRFTEDVHCRPERFDRLRHELGDAFLAVEIDSSRGNAYGISRHAHSVVTLDMVDEVGHPTKLAEERVLAFFVERLK